VQRRPCSPSSRSSCSAPVPWPKKKGSRAAPFAHSSRQSAAEPACSVAAVIHDERTHRACPNLRFRHRTGRDVIRSALRLVRPCSDTTDPSRSRSFLTFAPSPTFAFAPHAVAMFMARKRGRGARLASRRCDLAEIDDAILHWSRSQLLELTRGDNPDGGGGVMGGHNGCGSDLSPWNRHVGVWGQEMARTTPRVPDGWNKWQEAVQRSYFSTWLLRQARWHCVGPARPVACSRDDLQGRPCSWMDRSALLDAMKTRPSTTFATDAFSSLPPFNIASQDALRMAPHRPTYSRGRKSGHRGRQRTHLAAWEQELWAIDSIPA